MVTTEWNYKYKPQLLFFFFFYEDAGYRYDFISIREKIMKFFGLLSER